MPPFGQERANLDSPRLPYPLPPPPLHAGMMCESSKIMPKTLAEISLARAVTPRPHNKPWWPYLHAAYDTFFGGGAHLPLPPMPLPCPRRLGSA